MGSREDLPARGQLGRSADHPDAAVLPEELPEPKDEKQPVGAGQSPLFYIGGSNGASM